MKKCLSQTPTCIDDKSPRDFKARWNMILFIYIINSQYHAKWRQVCISPTKVKNKKGMNTIPDAFKYYALNTSWNNKARERN